MRRYNKAAEELHFNCRQSNFFLDFDPYYVQFFAGKFFKGLCTPYKKKEWGA